MRFDRSSRPRKIPRPGRRLPPPPNIFLAFSTGYGVDLENRDVVTVDMLPFFMNDPLLEATVHATEEAIVNALVAAQTMEGIDGNTIHALPHDRLQEVLLEYNRLNG